MLSQRAALLLLALVTASALVGVRLPSRCSVALDRSTSSTRSIGRSTGALYNQPEGSEGSEGSDSEKFSLSSLFGEPDSPSFRRILAAASSLLGAGIFALQYSQPVSGIALLHAMEKESMPIAVRAHIYTTPVPLVPCPPGPLVPWDSHPSYLHPCTPVTYPPPLHPSSPTPPPRTPSATASPP
jgi:hypothetical protein